MGMSMAKSKKSIPLSERKAHTRQKLLEATLAVMAEGGLHGVSVDAVAKRVGVTKGAVYDNFESKDALIVAALASIPPDERMATPLVFTAHSIPSEMASASR